MVMASGLTLNSVIYLFMIMIIGLMEETEVQTDLFLLMKPMKIQVHLI